MGNKILIVDDSTSMSQLISYTLQGGGYKVIMEYTTKAVVKNKRSPSGQMENLSDSFTDWPQKSD